MDLEYEADEYVSSLKRTFGNDNPTWGMVRVAYIWGAYQASGIPIDEDHAAYLDKRFGGK